MIHSKATFVKKVAETISEKVKKSDFSRIFRIFLGFFGTDWTTFGQLWTTFGQLYRKNIMKKYLK